MIPPGGIDNKGRAATTAQWTDPLHSAWMDPRDQLRALPDGMACTVCDEPVPAERMLLARRDDMTFVQIECTRCGSRALEFVAARQGQ